MVVDNEQIMVDARTCEKAVKSLINPCTNDACAKVCEDFGPTAIGKCSTAFSDYCICDYPC